jgi:hypothetical protein
MNDPFGYNVFACTIVAAVTLTAGAVTIVHASQRGSPSPAASVNQGLSGSAPKSGQFEAVPETAPGAYADTYDSHEPLPLSRSRMVGEWYGLDSNQSMLITLKIGQEGEPTRLALARRRTAFSDRSGLRFPATRLRSLRDARGGHDLHNLLVRSALCMGPMA